MQKKTNPLVNPVLHQTSGPPPAGRRGLGGWGLFSLTGFIAVNVALPIGGLYYFQWDLYEMAVLYWTENLIIGIFMLLQVLSADTGSLNDDKKMFRAIPSLLVYFPLCLGQAVLIQVLFQKTRTHTFFEGWPLGMYAIEDLLRMAFIQIMWPTLAMAANYTFIYVHDYIQTGECFRASVGRLAFIPVVRLLMMQVLVMAGLALKKANESLLGLFVAVIVMKILLEWLFDWYKQREIVSDWHIKRTEKI